MKQGVKTLFVLLVTTMLVASCDPIIHQEDKSKNSISILTSKDALRKTHSDTIINAKKNLLEIFLFKYSECIEKFNDKERIIFKKEKGDSLVLKIGAFQNCIGKFRPEIKSQHDTLLINLEIKEQIVKRKNGHIDTIVVMNECDCYFYFNFGIKNLIGTHKTVLLNGKKIGSGQPHTILVPDENAIYIKEDTSSR